MHWAEASLGCIRMGKQAGLRAVQSFKAGRARSSSIVEYLDTSGALEPDYHIPHRGPCGDLRETGVPWSDRDW